MSGIQAALLATMLATVVVGCMSAIGVDLEPILIDEADPVDYEELPVGITLPIRSIIVDEPDPATASVEDPDSFSSF